MRLKEYMTLDGSSLDRRPTRGHARGTTHGSSRGAKVRFTGLVPLRRTALYAFV